MITASLMMTVALAQGTPDLSSLLQTRFRDASFTAQVGTANFAELRKISTDFSQSYRFKSSQVWLKEPFMLRMVSTIDDTQITYVVNGGTKLTRVPRSNINVRENVSKAPGKRQTAFDFGILTPAMLRELFDAKFVRNDRATGDLVFDLTYKDELKDSSRHRVWFDPGKKVVTKREWYGQLKRAGGRLMATFNYDNPVTTEGVTLNTRVTVLNAENKVAGSANYTQMKINDGLADSLFATK